jgi:hypothetical protein
VNVIAISKIISAAKPKLPPYRTMFIAHSYVAQNAIGPPYLNVIPTLHWIACFVDGDCSVEAGVAGAVDLAHAARTQRGDDLSYGPSFMPKVRAMRARHYSP